MKLIAKQYFKHTKGRKPDRELVRMLGVKSICAADRAITKNINKFFISDLILAEGVDQDQQLTYTFSEAERSEKLGQIEVNIQELLCHLVMSQMSTNQQKQMAFSQEL